MASLDGLSARDVSSSDETRAPHDCRHPCRLDAVRLVVRPPQLRQLRLRGEVDQLVGSVRAEPHPGVRMGCAHPVIIWLSTRFRLERGTLAWRLPLHLVAAILLAQAHMILFLQATWMLTILLCVMFVLAGSVKFDSSEIWPRMFSEWGYPDGFVYVIGGIEVIAALVLLIPALAVACLGATALDEGARRTASIRQLADQRCRQHTRGRDPSWERQRDGSSGGQESARAEGTGPAATQRNAPAASRGSWARRSRSPRDPRTRERSSRGRRRRAASRRCVRS